MVSVTLYGGVLYQDGNAKNFPIPMSAASPVPLNIIPSVPVNRMVLNYDFF
jgi:hypothetical protein